MEQMIGLVVVMAAGRVGFQLTRWKLKILFQGIIIAAMAACWILVILAESHYLYKRSVAPFSGDLLTALRFSARMTFFAIPAAIIGWLGGIWLCLWESKDNARSRSPQK
jgi:lysylphosphatidylglycerol synthetase-like protein (DUF2156 family)